MKTILLILTISAVCFAGLFSREVKKGVAESNDHDPFTSILVIANEDSIVVIEKDLITSHVLKTVYYPYVIHTEIGDGAGWHKVETTGVIVNVPAKTEIEWNK